MKEAEQGHGSAVPVNRSKRILRFLYAVSAISLSASPAAAQGAPMCAMGPHEAETALFSTAVGPVDTFDADALSCVLGDPAYTGGQAFLTGGPEGDDAHRLATVRRAWRALADHRAAGRVDAALISLASLRELLPELADRWDLTEGELRAGERRGCDAFERATESPLSSIAARARVGHVRCLVELGDRGSSDALRQLLARYPELPEALELRVLDAVAREERGDVTGAIAIYRDIDLTSPQTREASDARARLTALEAAGHRMRPWTPLQRVERADRILRSGPPDLAREEIERLRATRLPVQQAAEVTLMAARLARVEGRFSDAAALTREARGLSPLTGGEQPIALAAAPTEEELAAARASADEEARVELRRFTNGARTLRRVNTTRLFGYIRSAARAGLRPELDLALDEIASRDLPCGLRLEAGIVAIGTADDPRVATVLAGCVDAPGSIGVASRYHRARALERAGSSEEARAEMERVIAADRSDTRWYAMWARQRLGAVPALAAAAITSPLDASSVPGDGKTNGPGPDALATLFPVLPVLDTTSSPLLTPDTTIPAETEPADAFDAPPARWAPLSPEELERRLSAIADRYREPYPWFARALSLVRLGETLSAGDELHEGFLAWNEARGRPALRAGVEAVYRGSTPSRMRAPSVDTWRARRSLADTDRRDLAEIAASLGDHGLAIRFAGPERAATRPRAYEDIVVEVARSRDLDPNLLLAVMRVESVYNPRIVSYAGAIGLLQIMPRTGRLIARSMGREDFGIDDLLDPRTNIEFAAWYLSSLIRRFDGRIPLAIASYNGGPHNVRRWMSEHSEDMPLDAFLERIPFDQTHRYVRRVLSHYAAYRAQQGLTMVDLDPTLPELEADHVAF